MGGVMVTVKRYQREAEPRALLEGHHYPDGQQRNVSEDERVISVAAGTFLGALGVSQRGLPGLLLAGLGVALFYRGATGACPAYKALGVDTAKRQSGVDVTEAFTIDKPAEQLYQFWRDFENLPRIMSHVRSVKTLEDGRLHWVDQAPSVTGGTVEWDAEILEDIPNERIAWRSLPGGDVDNAGSVSFEPGPRGTTVRVSLCYVPPGGHLRHHRLLQRPRV
ncbi:MAG: SRPBCC family protein, partial [Phycisphaeraceae bacterium]